MEKRVDSGHSPGEVAPESNQGWRTLWEKVLLFLEIIGLRAERKTGDYAAQLARFKLYQPSSGDSSPPTTASWKACPSS